MVDIGLVGWKLILAGASDVGRTDFVERLIKSAEGYDIDILENATFNEIKNLYSTAKIFWSSAGYKIDQLKNPEKLEHFGMTVVEAMSSGVVPIIFDGGGHREIIKNKVSQNAKTIGLESELRELLNKEGLLHTDKKITK